MNRKEIFRDPEQITESDLSAMAAETVSRHQLSLPPNKCVTWPTLNNETVSVGKHTHFGEPANSND